MLNTKLFPTPTQYTQLSTSIEVVAQEVVVAQQRIRQNGVGNVDFKIAKMITIFIAKFFFSIFNLIVYYKLIENNIFSLLFFLFSHS